jgi:hypothetical protein
MRNPFRKTERPFIKIMLPHTYAELNDDLAYRLMIYESLHAATYAAELAAFGPPEPPAKPNRAARRAKKTTEPLALVPGS